MGIRKKEFDIQEYMTKGVKRIVSDALKATLKDPRESAFMLRFAAASGKASKKRKKAEKQGEHIPPFLIASITSKCNLHCAGCYCGLLLKMQSRHGGRRTCRATYGRTMVSHIRRG